jgi:hypothetical protein
MSFSDVFPGRVAVSPAEAGRAVFGWSAKTTANRLLEGRFPLPVITLGGKRVCRLEDLAMVLAAEFVAPAPAFAVVPAPKRRRGRPSKLEGLNYGKK